MNHKLFQRDNGLGHGPRFVINLGRSFGVCFEAMPVEDGRRYLVTTIWYPRKPKRLGYLYPPSVRIR